LCATCKEFKTAFDSRSIAPESLHETMFREHFSGELKLQLDFPSQTASKFRSARTPSAHFKGPRRTGSAALRFCSSIQLHRSHCKLGLLEDIHTHRSGLPAGAPGDAPATTSPGACAAFELPKGGWSADWRFWTKFTAPLAALAVETSRRGAVPGRSGSLRPSSTRASDGGARLACRPSEGSRIRGAGPAVCGTFRARCQGAPGLRSASVSTRIKHETLTTSRFCGQI
jgi:hypothetical protein